MGKVRNLLVKYARIDRTLQAMGDVLYCNACSKEVSCTQKSHVTNHLGTKTHKSNTENWEIRLNKEKADRRKEAENGDPYFSELCEAFISADIPFHKLNNPLLAKFLQRYTGRKTPDESTLRKTYVQKTYDKTMDALRRQLKEKKIWISVDETSDLKKRSRINLIIGELTENGPTTPFIAASKKIDKCNNKTVARFVNTSLQMLFPGPKENLEDRLILGVTDAAPYMLLAMKSLQVFYPKMVHLTCLVHLLHNVCQKIMEFFKRVNLWISVVKKIFVKAKLRKMIFKEMNPELTLPPEPIVTRFGTWLNAAVYHNTNFEDVVKVVNALDEEDAMAIQEAQEMAQDPKLRRDLIFVSSNFGFLPEKLKKLESSSMLLSEAVSVVEEVRAKLGDIPGKRGEAIAQYLDERLESNPGYNTVKTIAKTHCDSVPGDIVNTKKFKRLTNKDVLSLKYGVVQSMDVERSFSVYKNILTDKRSNFTDDNLEMYVVCHCNLNNLMSSESKPETVIIEDTSEDEEEEEDTDIEEC